MNRTLVSLFSFALLSASFAGHAGVPLAVSAEDQRQIMDLVSASSYTYDGKDPDGYLKLYTQDCVWEAQASGASTPMVRAANREELRALVLQRFAMLREKGIQSRHYQTNSMLSARAEGQVEGTTMLNLMWQVPGEKPYTVTTGIYRDLFVKSEGSWKIARRMLLMDQAGMGK